MFFYLCFSLPNDFFNFLYLLNFFLSSVHQYFFLCFYLPLNLIKDQQEEHRFLLLDSNHNDNDNLFLVIVALFLV